MGARSRLGHLEFLELAQMQVRQKAWALAELSFLRCLRLEPNEVAALVGLAHLYRVNGRFKKAQHGYARALQQDPRSVDAHVGMALALDACGEHTQAQKHYQNALAVDPTSVSARWNLACTLLGIGDYAQGWPLYEARHDPGRLYDRVHLPDLPFPRWTGESLAGRSIVLWTEQGYGDHIQFARYLPLLRERGVSRLAVVCSSPMARLMTEQGMVDEVVEITPQGFAVPRCDYWDMMGSLPGRLGTTLETIPAKLPYLTADALRVRLWAERLPKLPTGQGGLQKGLRVGLVWKGRPTHANDAHRSLPGLDVLAPLWDVPHASNIQFISLQKGAGEDEAAAWAGHGRLLALGAALQDFADTAAVVAQLDVVITIDSAVAHLAGALNVPCWVLLPWQGTDWRWLHERSDSPWYPGAVRLFRQSAPADWRAPIAHMAQALAAWPSTEASGA